MDMTTTTPAYIKFHALPNLQFLCRICAGNMKNRIDETLSFIHNPALKDTCEKFLHIKLSSDDFLPKLICKACYRTVAGAEALANVAQQTQKVFGIYFDEEAKEKQVNKSLNVTTLSQQPSSKKRTAIECKPLELNLSKKNYKNHVNASSILPASWINPPSTANETSTAALQGQNKMPMPPARKPEVVLNVSVNDPLTRDNQQKVISNSQRRQSLLLDSRYTPKSIAQKSLAAVVRNQNQQQQKDVTDTMDNAKKQTPSGLINFFPNISTKQTNKKGLENDFVMRCRTSEEHQKDLTSPTETSSPNNSNANLNIPQQQTPVDFAQGKRRNAGKVLNNLNNITSSIGQMSLLKSSYKKTQEKSLPIPKIMGCSVDESLPEKMIIAAPKEKADKNKKVTLNCNAESDQNIDDLRMPPPSSVTGPNKLAPIFSDDIPLGRVIKDIDLLKLILKALKWPVTNVTFEAQMNRLRNSKFTDIMSDSNLLQDTDMVQLLQPYLAPVFLAAQAVQQQQFLKAVQSQTSCVVQPLPALNKPIDLTTLDINNSLPYKLPPETSVQLVPAQSQSENTLNKSSQSSSQSMNSLLRRERKTMIIESTALDAPSKRLKRLINQKPRDSIVISDEDDDNEKAPKTPPTCRKERTSSKASSTFCLDMNQVSLLKANETAVASGEVLITPSNRQKVTMDRQQRTHKRRHSTNNNISTSSLNEPETILDLCDDIILLDQSNTNVKETSSNDRDGINENSKSNSNKKQSSIDLLLASVIPRPIIKRRKTVIQTVMRNKPEPEITIDIEKSPPLLLKSKAKVSDTTPPAQQQQPKVIESGTKIRSDSPEIIQCSSDSSPTEILTETPPTVHVAPLTTNTEATVAVTAKSRKALNSSKSSLGQQLLEAVGLQKVSGQKTVTNSNSNTNSTETVTTSTLIESKETKETKETKDSVQQIRSAFKRSLKQVQEQQQQPQLQSNKSEGCTGNTTIIQDADSTTSRSLLKQAMVDSKQQNAESIMPMIDLEEQIDKVTLVRKSANEQQTKNAGNSTKKDKIKSGRASRSQNSKSDEKIPVNANAENVPEMKYSDDNNKQSLETGPCNISSSSSGAELPATATNENVTSSDTVTTVIKQETISTPRRRGRKRTVNINKDAEKANSNAQDGEEAEKAKSKEAENVKANANDNSDHKPVRKSGRPTRFSKTQSKYYKDPEKVTTGRRSLPIRITRNRKYP